MNKIGVSSGKDCEVQVDHIDMGAGEAMWLRCSTPTGKGEVGRPSVETAIYKYRTRPAKWVPCSWGRNGGGSKPTVWRRSKHVTHIVWLCSKSDFNSPLSIPTIKSC